MNRFFKPHLALAAIVQYCAPAYAVQYLTVEEAQRLLFPNATAFESVNHTITEGERAGVEERSGIEIREDTIHLWKVKDNNGFAGYLFVDKVIGKHELITYAVGFSAEHRILGVELMEYLETKGGEIEDKGWRSQFAGRTSQDPIKVGEDISNISGATLSCVHVTDGVRKLTHLLQYLDGK